MWTYSDMHACTHRMCASIPVALLMLRQSINHVGSVFRGVATVGWNVKGQNIDQMASDPNDSYGCCNSFCWDDKVNDLYTLRLGLMIRLGAL